MLKTRHIEQCPACESADVLHFESDSLCNKCDFDTFKVSVDAGDLDEAMAPINSRGHKVSKGEFIREKLENTKEQMRRYGNGPIF